MVLIITQTLVTHNFMICMCNFLPMSCNSFHESSYGFLYSYGMQVQLYSYDMYSFDE